MYKESIGGSFSLQSSRYNVNSYQRDIELVRKNLIDILGNLEFNSVLDVDCGKGSLLEIISKNYSDVSISGIDSSEDKLKAAKRRLGADSDLILCNSEILPWDQSSFDLVLCVNSFQHYRHPERVLAEIKRVIKPEGYLLITDDWKASPTRQLMNLLSVLFKKKIKIYSKSMIESFLDQYGFKLINWKLLIKDEYMLIAQLQG
ncbi:methyltransferase family protein [Orenia metallireducens]|uniref:Methyltransferase domain-containing protein n=1 Tax=Orenia metallireducens TaxID=1413210 RepID=A0A285GNX1_9FIRM|nr:methyltransferase domain-containing protein [Orenia metallireducens]PRX29792.1 methyltransferase family protein [Orenia metallireducens]SNY24894.1 Methyltransferase domain-containing protein [Orenia metallireducens]